MTVYLRINVVVFVIIVEERSSFEVPLNVFFGNGTSRLIFGVVRLGAIRPPGANFCLVRKHRSPLRHRQVAVATFSAELLGVAIATQGADLRKQALGETSFRIGSYTRNSSFDTFPPSIPIP